MIKLRTYLLYFLILVYLSGTVGVLLHPGFFLPFTPYSLFLTCTVFLMFQAHNNKRYIITFAAVAVLGFLVEWIGIRTGLIFGSYYYGTALGPKLNGVPISISLNWALLISSGLLVIGAIVNHRFLTPLFSSLMITALDFLIEQCASGLDYWYFPGNRAGLQNYLGWFIVSFMISLLFYKILVKGNEKLALLLLILQVAYFGTIFLFNELTL